MVYVVYVVTLLCNICVSCKNHSCMLSCKMNSNMLMIIVYNYHISITFDDKDGYIRQDGRVLSF